MPDSDTLLALQAQLILDLIRESDSTTVRLLLNYHAVFEKLSAQWLALLQELDAARGTSDLPTQSFDILLQQQERIRQLRLQTAAQVTRFTREAERLVTADQRMAVRVGLIHAERLMQEAVRITAPRVEISFARLPTRALENLVGRFSNGEPLRNLFDEIGPQAAQKAEQALFTAVATGMHPTIAARQLRTDLGVPLVRAMAIARTSMIQSYREASLQSFRENRDVIRAWRWNASLDARSCSSCLALHGSIHPLDEPFSEHVNGRCVPSPVLVPLSQLGLRGREPSPPQTGPDWFAEQSEADQLRVLGPGKLALYRSGMLDLEDTVYPDFSARWGLSYREGSIANSLLQHGAPKPWQRYD